MAVILTGTALSTDLATIRSKNTPIDVFRSAVSRIGMHLAVEVSKHLPSRDVEITTPLETTTCAVVRGGVVVVPILRAGLGILDPFLTLCPEASVGFIGLKRDELSLEPHEYYRNLPPSDENTTFIVIDPMLATGGSMSATIELLRHAPHGCIIATCLIASPEGVAKISHDHPDVLLVCGALDRQLNDKGYIMPGLGDAGDRMFGTI